MNKGGSNLGENTGSVLSDIQHGGRQSLPLVLSCVGKQARNSHQAVFYVVQILSVINLFTDFSLLQE